MVVMAALSSNPRLYRYFAITPRGNAGRKLLPRLAFPRRHLYKPRSNRAATATPGHAQPLRQAKANPF